MWNRCGLSILSKGFSWSICRRQNLLFFFFVYFIKSFIRNKLLKIVRCGTVQFCSCEITSGRICFRRFAIIFVFYNLYILMRLVSNISEIVIFLFVLETLRHLLDCLICTRNFLSIVLISRMMGDGIGGGWLIHIRVWVGGQEVGIIL